VGAPAKRVNGTDTELIPARQRDRYPPRAGCPQTSPPAETDRQREPQL